MPSDKRKEVVYICSPIMDKKTYRIAHNITRARGAAEKFLLRGYTVICAQTMYAFMHGLIPEEEFLAAAVELLRRSDIVLVRKGWTASKGCVAEVKEAQRLGKRIIYEEER